MSDGDCLWFVFCPPAETVSEKHVWGIVEGYRYPEDLGAGAVCSLRWHCIHLLPPPGTPSWWHCRPWCPPCQHTAQCHRPTLSTTPLYLPAAASHRSQAGNQRPANIYCKLNAINIEKSDRAVNGKHNFEGKILNPARINIYLDRLKAMSSVKYFSLTWSNIIWPVEIFRLH